LPGQISVDIVEPSKSAQLTAKSRLDEVPYNSKMFHFSWHESIEEINDKHDVVVVATTAAGRVKLIDGLLDKGESRFLLEKMVCQSATEYDHLLSAMKNCKTWVNTNRRYFESYQKIKPLFEEGMPIHMSVVSGNQGLGSNAIHFIDLFCWLAGSFAVKLDGRLLSSKIYLNRRGNDLLEFGGTIIGKLDNESFFEITFLPYDDLPYTVAIAGRDNHIIVDETGGQIYSLKGQPLVYKNEYISGISTTILKDIFEQDKCLLPTLEQSSTAHYELFRLFNEHLRELTGKERDLCPIT
jgi:hypothetical protein